MASTVSSLNGRRWLQSQRPAVTALGAQNRNQTADIIQTPIGDEQESLSAVSDAAPLESIAVPAAEAVFATRDIYNQLHGTHEIPAVEHMNQIKIPPVGRPVPAQHQIVFVNVPNVSTESQLSDVSDSSELSELLERSVATGKEVKQPSSDASTVENPESDSVSSATLPGTGASKTASQPATEITRLVDSILERFPLAAPAVLLFVGTEENPHVDETCARISSEIASRKVGNILLVDADVDGRRLTIASGLDQQTGYAECVNRSQPWREKVISRDGSSFGFLPVGNCEMDRWNVKQLLLNCVAEMKQDYQFVCVSAGSAHSAHAKLWYDTCDGSYLVLSMKSTNETIAQSSVNEMREGGARLLGCVVTDVE